MESGILIVHKLEVPVLPFIADCVGMFSAQAREGDVTISIVNGTSQFHDVNAPSKTNSNVNGRANVLLDSGTLFMDRFKMDQMSRNLISNALKFTPRGGEVTVTASFVPFEPLTTKSLLSRSAEFPLLRGNSFGKNPVNHLDLSANSSTRVHSSFYAAGRIHADAGDIEANLSFKSNLPTRQVGKLIIVVKDSGSGMLNEDYTRLFKEIVQFNPGVLQAGGGSGLGLWITKGIVDLHAGKVSVHSAGLGLGNLFTVELGMGRTHNNGQLQSVPEEAVRTPLTRTIRNSMDENYYDEDDILVNEEESIKEFDGSVGRGERGTERGTESGTEVASEGKESEKLGERKIKKSPSRISSKSVTLPPIKKVLNLLIVDDSSLNRKMLIKTFRSAGHNCEEAEDGVQAIKKVEEKMGNSGHFCAILMDFVMPNMDGPTATKEIRALGYTAPIFGLTGSTLDSDITHFLLAGANKVLAKPLDTDCFHAAMKDVKEWTYTPSNKGASPKVSHRRI